jgi:sugar lactone lactonase YvrE
MAEQEHSCVRVGDVTLGWGESLVWDDERQRLYFVDCATSTLYWRDEGASALHSFVMPSMPTGVVPTVDGPLVVVLDDGLSVVDADARTVEHLADYPVGLGDRANDACADLEGNLITGTLNLGPGKGSTWWFSTTDGWRLLDDDISNTNGPQAAVLGAQSTLIVGDTSADYFAYPYDATVGSVGERSVFGPTSALEGLPDGSALDEEGGLWCALVGGGQLARFTVDGLDRTVPLPVSNPTDVTFGGADLDRLYVVSIAGEAELDGALLVIDGLGVAGRPEPRFALR